MTAEQDPLVEEIVAYYKLYDFHEVWTPAGARALVDWLVLRGVLGSRRGLTRPQFVPIDEAPDSHWESVGLTAARKFVRDRAYLWRVGR